MMTPARSKKTGRSGVEAKTHSTDVGNHIALKKTSYEVGTVLGPPNIVH